MGLHKNRQGFSKFILSYAAAIIAILAGVVVLTGWQSGTYRLTTFNLGTVPMSPSAALGIIIGGISLIFVNKPGKRYIYFVYIGALLLVILGVLTISEYLGKWDAGIDHLLFPENRNPGRMSFYDALSFLFIGATYFFLTIPNIRRKYFVETAIMIVFSINFYGLLWFWLGYSGFPGYLNYSFTAKITSLTLVLLTVGIYQVMRFHWHSPLTLQEKLFRILIFAAFTFIFFSLLSASDINFLNQLFKENIQAKSGSVAVEKTRIIIFVSIGLEILFLFLIFFLVSNDYKNREKARTELTQINKELTAAKNEAEEANRAKSEFLSRMSHELRTPMNSILGFAQLMNMGELIPAHKKRVGHIIRSGKHLLALINEVLDISKIEAGHISLAIEPVDVYALMNEIKEIVNPLAAEHQVTLIIIPPEHDLLVKADLRRLKQVFLNLANNAIKYNHLNGFVNVNCVVTAADGKQNPCVRINISDSGVGISTEDMKKLFNPFQRIGAEKTETEGTGLGLVVVKKLVEAMGGIVGVESELGNGSTFWVELPLAESRAKQPLLQENLKEQASETAQKKGTILYIEDNSPNIELVEHILKDHRTSVRVITDKYGKNTFRLATEYKPELILLDLNLPDIHGHEVLAQLQGNAQTKSIPVVIISADAMEKQVKTLLKAGAKDYLTKPLDVVEFLSIVDEWM